MNKSIKISGATRLLLSMIVAAFAAQVALSATSFLVPIEFPDHGVRAIFRDDFPFVTQKNVTNPHSIPHTRFGNGVKLLTSGESRLEWRLRLADEAANTLRVQTYIFTADESGKMVADKLKKRRADGLDVRLTIDTYTKFCPADRTMFNALELSGITVMGFEPWYLLGTSENRLLNYKDVNMRYHEKYWIADESAAIVGGANIADEYFQYGEDPDSKWRDQDVLLTGPIVKDVVKAFDDNSAYFAERRDDRFWFNRATFFRGPWWELTDTRPPGLIDNIGPDMKPLPESELDAIDVPVRFIRHRPRYREDYILQVYMYLIDSARSSILIENAYFVPNRELITALMRAAKRGVKVVIITNSNATNDVSGMQPLSRYSYEPLMNYGVEIYEWQGEVPRRGALHSKLAVFDGQVTIIGSCNLDPRSFNINSENIVVLDSGEIAALMTETVVEQDLPISALITKEQAKKWRHPRRNGERFRLNFGMAMESWY